MRPSFTPIQTCIREPAAERSGCLQVDAERRKRVRSSRGEAVRTVHGCRIGRQPFQRLEAIVERHAQCSRHVIVASSRSA